MSNQKNTVKKEENPQVETVVIDGKAISLNAFSEAVEKAKLNQESAIPPQATTATKSKTKKVEEPQHSAIKPEEKFSHLEVVANKAKGQCELGLKAGYRFSAYTCIWETLSNKYPPYKKACLESLPETKGNNKERWAVMYCTSNLKEVAPSTLTAHSQVVKYIFAENKERDFSDTEKTVEWIVKFIEDNGGQGGCIRKFLGKDDGDSDDQKSDGDQGGSNQRKLTQEQIDKQLKNYKERDDVIGTIGLEDVSELEDGKLIVAIARKTEGGIEVVDMMQDDDAINYFINKKLP